MVAHPLVSVIIPSLNQAKFIEETINSVLLQNYRPLEVIIVDGCSTDETLKILHKYDHVPHVKWISEPDHGHADGINKGFSRAKGEIVAWLNADDVYFSNNVLYTVVAFFARNPQIDVLYGDAAIISADSTLLRLFLLPSYNKGRILRQNLISQPAVFMRKRVVENEKLTTDQIGLDYDYWLRLITKGFRFHHLKKILACDRHYPARLSVTKKAQIQSQIGFVKTKMELSKRQAQFMYPVDRSFQAACRVKGLMVLMLMPLFQDKQHIVFPLRIDSHSRLLWRQLTRAIGSDFNM